MDWSPVEYRESCARIRGVWSVVGLVTALAPGPRRDSSMMETWPAQDSPQSQPERAHWFRDRLFSWHLGTG